MLDLLVQRCYPITNGRGAGFISRESDMFGMDDGF